MLYLDVPLAAEAFVICRNKWVSPAIGMSQRGHFTSLPGADVTGCPACLALSSHSLSMPGGFLSDGPMGLWRVGVCTQITCFYSSVFLLCFLSIHCALTFSACPLGQSSI